MATLTKKRILLLAWVGLMAGMALQPLQWRDPHWPFYSAAAGLLAVLQVIRAAKQWNNPDA
jgi:hypothetical protein